MKNKIIYIIGLVLFIITVFFITITYLVINKQSSGNIIVNEKYSDIVFTNTYIDYSSSASIKVNNEEKVVHINIPNLNEIQSNNSFLIDITNIGNIEKKINTNITNFSSNISENNISIDILFDNGNIINGGETKRIRVNVSHNNLVDITSLSFNINFSFE